MSTVDIGGLKTYQLDATDCYVRNNRSSSPWTALTDSQVQQVEPLIILSRKMHLHVYFEYKLIKYLDRLA